MKQKLICYKSKDFSLFSLIQSLVEISLFQQTYVSRGYESGRSLNKTLLLLLSWTICQVLIRDNMCLLQSYPNLLRIIVSNLIIVDANQIAKNYFRADKFIYLKFLPQFLNMHRLASDLTVFFVTEG